MGWEVKNDMSGQSQDVLGACKVKIRKYLPGYWLGTFPRICGLTTCSINQFELFSSKMVKLDYGGGSQK